jgi:5-methylcytosine-specific restriction endonuclease McrA
MRGARSAMFRGDKDPNRGADWNRIAERVRERDGYTCRWCGKTQADNRQKLSIDHVIPWRLFDNKAAANDLSNLIALCRSCHMRKTASFERLMMQGDFLALEDYRRQVGLTGGPSGAHAPTAERMVNPDGYR